jgi:hypothetical protein
MRQLCVVLSFLLISTLVIATHSPAASSSGEDWSRSYLGSVDRVWQAVIEVLSEADYYIEKEDRKKGRIQAESPGRGFDAIVLDIRIRIKKEKVRVEVQASGGGVRSPADFGRLDGAVEEFLRELDVELKQ